MNELILVVDDEPKIIKLARDYLEKNGFRVLEARDGKTGLACARREKPDLIVLDLMLPEMDGLDVCRVLRQESDVPIIMLTARSEETDRLIGLEIGADDYITKPFSPRELVARVRTVLRRVQGNVRQFGLITIGELEVDIKGFQVKKAGELLHLTPNEFNILIVFVQHAGQTLTRAQLMQHLHGYSQESFDRSIDSHIKNLRRKIETDPSDPEYIQTVYGIGYRFNENH